MLIEKHKRYIDGLHETYKVKNSDYGNSFGETYKELGPISAVTRISDKYRRMVQLTLNGDKNRLVEDEALKDTLLDLANYAIMYAMELTEDEVDLELEELKRKYEVYKAETFESGNRPISFLPFAKSLGYSLDSED